MEDICTLSPANFHWDEIPRVVYTPGKTRKLGREESVRLPDDVVEYVRQYLSELAASCPDSPHCTPMLAQRTSGSRGRTFLLLLKEAGVEQEWITKGARKLGRKTFHGFRHTVVSILRHNGITMSDAMAFVGHTTRSASKTYTHQLPGWDILKAKNQGHVTAKLPSLAPLTVMKQAA